MKKKTENRANKMFRLNLNSICFILLLFAGNANAANYYWVGGSGNWSDFTNHWATTSGGTNFHTSVPGPTDDVYFDSNSFTASGQAVNIDVIAPNCTNFSWQNTIAESKLTSSSTSNELYIKGNFIGDLSIDMQYDGKIVFTTTNTVTVNFTDTIRCPLQFISDNLGSGRWNFTSDFYCKNLIGFESGKIDISGTHFTCGTFTKPNLSNGMAEFIGNNSNATIVFIDSALTIEPEFNLDNFYPITANNITLELLNNNASYNGYVSWYFREDWLSGSVKEILFDATNAASSNVVIIDNLSSDVKRIKGSNFNILIMLSNLNNMYNGGTCFLDTVVCVNCGIEINNSAYFDSWRIDYIQADYLGLNKASWSGGVDTSLLEINKVNCTINCGIEMWGNFNTSINDITIGGDIICKSWQGNPAVPANYNFYAGKISIAGNAMINNDCTFDTLILMPGSSFTLDSNKTLTINNKLVASGNPIDSIYINSSSIGDSANFNLDTNYVCLNYVALRDIHVSGTNTYANINCTDLGNNTGWQFGPCNVISDVWPGDANYDLTANNNDVLNIGVAYGNSGPVRSGASLAWVAQPATDWTNYFANGTNHKHADTNGDGVVDNNDTAAITLNYGLTHPARYGADLINSLVDPPLYLSALSDTLAEGDSVTVTITLGTAALPVTDLYGLAFTINFNNTVLDTNYIAFDFTGCWIGTPGVNLLTYTYQRSTDGAIDVAITRTDQLDTSGFGYVGRFGSVIVDNVGARLASGNFMNANFTISNITAIHFDETLLPLAAFGDSIVIDTAGTTGIKTQEALAGKVIIYPNPASDKLMIRSGNLKVVSLEVVNSMGHKVLKQNNLMEGHAINTTILSQGLYILKLQTEAGVVVKKFQVVKKLN